MSPEFIGFDVESPSMSKKVSSSAARLTCQSRHFVAMAVVLLLPVSLAADVDDSSDFQADDVAAAEQTFEQKRKAREIVSWADARARAAVRNSPTVQAHEKEKRETTMALCKAKVSERGWTWRPALCDGGVLIDEIRTELANHVDRTVDEDAKDVVAELRNRFIQERLSRERERLEDELYNDLLRQLQSFDDDLTI